LSIWRAVTSTAFFSASMSASEVKSNEGMNSTPGKRLWRRGVEQPPASYPKWQT
jgi:hypothetical protein